MHEEYNFALYHEPTEMFVGGRFDWAYPTLAGKTSSIQGIKVYRTKLLKQVPNAQKRFNELKKHKLHAKTIAMYKFMMSLEPEDLVIKKVRLQIDE